MEQLLEEFAAVSLMGGRRAVVRKIHVATREILTAVGPPAAPVLKVMLRINESARGHLVPSVDELLSRDQFVMMLSSALDLLSEATDLMVISGTLDQICQLRRLSSHVGTVWTTNGRDSVTLWPTWAWAWSWSIRRGCMLR